MARRTNGDSVELEEGRSIRVLLAEDMDLLRTALVSLLSVEEDIEVIADLKCNEKAVSVAVRLRPDVAVVSADLPENKGLRLHWVENGVSCLPVAARRRRRSL